MVESHFSKVRETSRFCNSVEKNLTRAWYVPKNGFSRNFEKFPFNRVAGLQYSVCNATKNKLLTKFLKCALKLTENF